MENSQVQQHEQSTLVQYQYLASGPRGAVRAATGGQLGSSFYLKVRSIKVPGPSLNNLCPIPVYSTHDLVICVTGSHSLPSLHSLHSLHSFGVEHFLFSVPGTLE